MIDVVWLRQEIRGTSTDAFNSHFNGIVCGDDHVSNFDREVVAEVVLPCHAVERHRSRQPLLEEMSVFRAIPAVLQYASASVLVLNNVLILVISQNPCDTREQRVPGLACRPESFPGQDPS